MSGWSDERVALLKKLWADGLSASQVAGRLGSVTRNAVISKIHRLGLSERVGSVKKRTSARRYTNAKKPPRPQGQHPRFGAPPKTPFQRLPPINPTELIALADTPPANIKTIHALEDCDCRWPFGEIGAKDFGYCGKQKAAGLPYCEVHAARAYVVPIRRPKTTPAVRPAINRIFA